MLLENLLVYVLIGFIWSWFCIYVSIRLNYPSVPWYQKSPGFLINWIFWPVSMIMGAYRIVVLLRNEKEDS